MKNNITKGTEAYAFLLAFSIVLTAFAIIIEIFVV
mgnify:FL=1